MPTLHALLRSAAVATTLLVAAASLSARPAQACSMAAPYFELTEPADTWVGVPHEGVLVFHGTQHGDPTYAGGTAEDLQIVVRDAEGAEIPGAVETVPLRSDINAAGYTGMSYEEQRVLVVWRADETLAPSSDYTAELDWSAISGSGSFTVSFETRAEPFPSLQEPMVSAPVAERTQLSVDGAYTCEYPEEPTGSCPDCTITDIEDMIALRTDLAEGRAAVPGGRYVYRRVVLEEDLRTVTRHARVWGGEERTEATVYARSDAAGTYCVSIEAVSLVDGSTVRSELACAEAQPEMVAAEPPPGDPAGDDIVYSCAAGGEGLPRGGVLLAAIALGALALRRRRA